MKLIVKEGQRGFTQIVGSAHTSYDLGSNPE